jgi:hypothetical protein
MDRPMTKVHFDGTFRVGVSVTSSTILTPVHGGLARPEVVPHVRFYLTARGDAVRP